jgi:hypothetical protein
MRFRRLSSSQATITERIICWGLVVPGAAVTKSLTEVHCEWEEKEKEQQQEEEEVEQALVLLLLRHKLLPAAP